VLDGKAMPSDFEPLRRTLTANIPSSALGAGAPHVLTIHHANLLGNHNSPQRYEITSSDGKTSVKDLPPRRPSRPPATRGSIAR